jgi:flagella basal body P-ring formation protein FlgA
LAPRMCVWLEIRHVGRSVGSVPVWFSVKAYRSVLVTQRSRAAREAVGTDELAVEERDVAPLSDIPLPLGTELARMRMRRAVMTGHVLLNSDIEEIPAVLKGQEVAVDVKHGTVAIETRAVALREARLGEPVMLQNPASHETYMAQVVGNGRAEVVDR